MKTIVKIYQLDKGIDYKFMKWNFAKDKFNFNDYKQVAKFDYDAKGSTVENDLEHIFELGNTGVLTELYKMNSISVSDVIEIDNAKFYVDSIGFKLLEGAR